MKKIMLVMVAFLLVGCATSKQIRGPNDKPAYFVKCGSSAMDACYEEAAKVCPTGYAFLDRQSSPNATAIPTAGGGFIMAHGPNQMLIECK